MTQGFHIEYSFTILKSAGYVDVVLGGLLGWVRASDELLVAWSERFGALEAVEPLEPDVSRLVEFGKMLKARLAAPPAAGASN